MSQPEWELASRWLPRGISRYFMERQSSKDNRGTRDKFQKPENLSYDSTKLLSIVRRARNDGKLSRPLARGKSCSGALQLQSGSRTAAGKMETSFPFPQTLPRLMPSAIVFTKWQRPATSFTLPSSTAVVSRTLDMLRAVARWCLSAL